MAPRRPTRSSLCANVARRPERKERDLSAKQGAAWKQERTAGRKYSGADSAQEPGPGERERFWVSGYTRKDGKQVEGYYKQNPSRKNM